MGGSTQGAGVYCWQCQMQAWSGIGESILDLSSRSHNSSDTGNSLSAFVVSLCMESFCKNIVSDVCFSMDFSDEDLWSLYTHFHHYWVMLTKIAICSCVYYINTLLG